MRFKCTFATLPPPLINVNLGLGRISCETYISECVPANQTSCVCKEFPDSGVSPDEATPPHAYSGRNFTRRSSKARACRKKQTCFIPSVVPGRLLLRANPIEDTVSLSLMSRHKLERHHEGPCIPDANKMHFDLTPKDKLEPCCHGRFLTGARRAE